MDLRFHTLDVFTTSRFGGNPLAVVLGADGLADAAMQAVAREFNFSETVFVQTPADPASTAKLRISTPFGELPFAGHPTVGTAVLLAQLEEEPAPGDAGVRLEEKVGLVPVAVRDRTRPAPYGELTAAVLPSHRGERPVAEAAALLGLAADDVGFAAHRPAAWTAGNEFLFVPLASRDALARARLDTARAAEGDIGVGVYAYCRGERVGVDFHARMLAAAGSFEDPATGSAAAAFPGPLAAAEALADGTARWRIAQGEDMGRPSTLFVEADIAGGRPIGVRVGGHAVRVMQGTITV